MLARFLQKFTVVGVWFQTRVASLSCGAICVMMCFVILTCDRRTDKKTDRQTQHHYIYRTSIASLGRNGSRDPDIAPFLVGLICRA